MDLNALRRMARKQRETEEAEDNIAPEATVKRVVPAEEPTADTEIYVPLEDDVAYNEYQSAYCRNYSQTGYGIDPFNGRIAV